MKRSTKYGNNYWHGYSPKVKRDVHFFSDLEYEHWLLVECDPNIETFCEQPLKVSYLHNDKMKSSIFDMWVQYSNGTEEFREIKYQSHLEPNHKKYLETSKQISVQKNWCSEKNIQYSLQTDDVIRSNMILLDNCRIIVSFVRLYYQMHKQLLQSIISFLSDKKASISSLCEYFTSLPTHSDQDVKIAIFYGLYIGVLKGSLGTQPITNGMEVWI